MSIPEFKEKIPGFNAEYALVKTSERYQLVAAYSSWSEEGTAILPQGCSWWRWAICGAIIAGCTATIAATAGTVGVKECVAGVSAFCVPCVKE